MKNHTKTGLLLILIGLIIGMFANLFLFLLSYTFESTDIEGIIPILIPAIIPAAIGGLLALVGFILVIVGRRDYGEKHSKFAIYAIIIFVINIILGAIISAAQSFMTYSSISYSSLFSEPSAYDPSGMILIMTLQTIIAAILGGLMYLFLLYHLENKTGRHILFAAFFSAVIFSFIMAIYNYLTLEELFTSIYSDPTSYGIAINYLSSLSRISILGIIGNILLVFAVYIPYKRINSGELSPVLPSHQKRCMNCGRVSRSDYKICPYCGKQYFDTKLNK